MEHSKAYLSRIWTPIWITILCVVVSACKKQEENPEKLDPIYADLSSKADAVSNKCEEQKKKIEELRNKLGKYGPRDPEQKQTLREKENLTRALILMQESASYYSIRAQQRKVYDKESYTIAFKNDQAWPPPQDFIDYKESNKLKNASRDWNASVPIDKSHNRPVTDKKKKKEEKKSE